MRPLPTGERGMALVMSCLMVTVVTILGSAMMVQSQAEHQVVRRYSSLSSAFQLAEAGADQVLVNLQAGLNDDVAAVELSGGSYWADVEDLGSSRYRITSHGAVGQIQRNIEMVVSTGGESVFPYGIFGDTEVRLKKKSTTDSYDSSQGDYDPGTADDNGDVATNSIEDDSLEIGKNSEIHGQVTVGPDTDDPEEVVKLEEPVTITASPPIVSTSEALALPAIDTSGLSCDESFTLPKNSTYTFTEADGPYCFDALEADTGSVIAVSGNVVIYVNNMDFDKNLQVNTAGKPTQLIIQVYGTSDVVIDKDGTFVGAIYAPNAKIQFKKDVTLYGAIAAEEIDLEKDLHLHYDEDLMNYGPIANPDITIESWREL